MKLIKRFLKKKPARVLFFIIVFACLPAAWSLLRPGLFVSDDAEWMVIRLTAFHQALAVGELPVRFAFRLNHGYGYPVFNFVYPGGFYLGEIFHLIGMNFVNAIKMVFGLSIILVGLFSFLWLRTRFSPTASFLGSLFYVYTPYFLWDVYKRGSMGEVLALALVPLFLLAIEKRNWWLGGLAYGMLVISHNIIAFIFTPIFILYIFLTNRTLQKAIGYTLATILLGLALSAFFWLPAIWESRLTVLSQTVVGKPLEHFASNISLLGVINLFVLFFALLLFLKKKEKLVGFFIAIFVLAIFLSTQVSVFFWRIFPWSYLFQYPFRFLSLTLPAAAFLAAFVFEKSFEKKRAIWLGLILVVLFFFSMPFARPTEFVQKEEGFYLTNEHSTTIHNEFMPTWAKVHPTERPQEKVEVIEGQAQIEAFKDGGKRIEFKTNSEKPVVVRVNTLYYPGWQVFIDGEKASFSFENDRGVIEIPIEKGEHQVLVKFGEVPFRLFTDAISLAGIIFVGGLLIKRKFK